MNQLPILGNSMFLNESISVYIKHINQEHNKTLSFAKRLNEVSHKALFNVRVKSSEIQQVLLVSLLQRAMKSFQASVILFERGLPEEGQVALRTLLEVTFKTVAIAKSAEVADAFIKEDKVNRKKFIKKYTSLSSVLEETKAKLNENLIQLNKEISDDEANKLDVKWLAEKAGLEDLYNTAYAVLSSTVHINISTLENVLDIDTDGKLKGMKYGFSDVDIDEHILTLSECMLLTLRAAFSLGDISESNVSEIMAMHQEFNELSKELISS